MQTATQVALYSELLADDLSLSGRDSLLAQSGDKAFYLNLREAHLSHPHQDPAFPAVGRWGGVRRHSDISTGRAGSSVPETFRKKRETKILSLM